MLVTLIRIDTEDFMTTTATFYRRSSCMYTLLLRSGHGMYIEAFSQSITVCCMADNSDLM